MYQTLHHLYFYFIIGLTHILSVFLNFIHLKNVIFLNFFIILFSIYFTFHFYFISFKESNEYNVPLIYVMIF